MYKKYDHMGRIEQLRYSGREFIGKKILFTVKRDGQNVPIYVEDNEVKIGSRNLDTADGGITAGVKATKEFGKYIEILKESPHWIMYAELMSGGRGPTSIEMPKKGHSLILFDIYDTKQERYLSYNFVSQQAHKYKIPIVELYTEFDCESLDELYDERDKALEWCKIHHREGVVIKDYYSEEQIKVKEKIDLPKPKKTNRKVDPKSQLPPMPLEKIRSAVEQAMADVKRNGGDIKNPKDAMPTIVIYINTEAREHCYNPPAGIFQYYQDYLKTLVKVK